MSNARCRKGDKLNFMPSLQSRSNSSRKYLCNVSTYAAGLRARPERAFSLVRCTPSFVTRVIDEDVSLHNMLSTSLQYLSRSNHCRFTCMNCVGITFEKNWKLRYIFRAKHFSLPYFTCKRSHTTILRLVAKASTPCRRCLDPQDFGWGPVWFESVACCSYVPFSVRSIWPLDLCYRL